MKKSIALVALAFGVTNAFAQDLTSKKGEPILPEAGDWAIAVDATPFLNYAGNLFGKTANNTAPTWNFFTNAQTITGKYFQDAETAYRGSLRIGMNSNTQRNMVVDQLKNAAVSPTANGFPTPIAEVENKWRRSNTVIGLAAGIEKRKGKTRLQGYYGGEAGIYMAMQKDKFTYGNALAATANASTNVNVSSTDAFAGANNLSSLNNINGVTSNGGRATEIKTGTVFSFGVRGFIGAEYFILPKISLGGEFGWGIGLTSQGKTSTSWEFVGDNGNPANTQNSVGTAKIEGAKNGSFSLDTDGRNSVWGPSGTLRLNFHF
jgi:hypothetical protein